MSAGLSETQFSHTAPRVLLVDRDPAGVEAITGALSECFTCAPEIALTESGRAAWDLLRRGPFDLVVADVATLSDLASGAEESVARLAKVCGGALTLALSTDQSVSAALSAMRAGAHDYVAKPVTASSFALRVAALALRHGRLLNLRTSFVPQAAGSPETGAAVGEPSRPDGAPAAVPGRQAIVPMWLQEQRIIEDAIATCAGNVTLAAAALQLSPSTIYRKRQAWNCAPGENRGAA